MERKRFVAALTMLSETLAASKPLSDAALEGYWIGLHGLTDGQIRDALAHALRSCKFMPAPRELRDFVEAPTRITAAMEWANVRRIVDKVDVYGSPDFGALTNAVIHALGGWRVLCEKSIPDLVWYQKDFERIYADFAGKDLSSLRTEAHIGSFGQRPEWMALPGTPRPQQQIESATRHEVADFVRELAEKKAI